ncbi:atexpb2, expb2, athexp beta 1.4 atexpb2 (expansin b2), partial [Musa troglodytarum]
SALQLPGLSHHLQGGQRIQPILLRRAPRVRRWGRRNLGRRLAARGLVVAHADFVWRRLEAELGNAIAWSIFDPADLRRVEEDRRCHQRHPGGLETRGHLHVQRQLLTSLKQCTKVLLI